MVSNKTETQLIVENASLPLRLANLETLSPKRLPAAKRAGHDRIVAFRDLEKNKE